ncbi:hypothetical protein [Fredinandcohnia onubensis]|uniref:hypothetical protein n=1 Tax=Fredinandcohnia onubensis TaxID=1571209 RepID=UPI000C0BBED8|nr:hypothetical protein [Fredinandcohnia onubensis]
MFVFHILLAITGMAMLILILIFFVYTILRNKKNYYSWFILAVIVFLLGVALWQSLSRFK